MVTWNDVFDATFGLTGVGFAIAFAVKLLRIVTRYNVLLSGQALEDLDAVETHTATGMRSYHYRLRIQSLETTKTAYPIQVTIKGIPDGTNIPSRDYHVWVAAGWKCVHVLSTFAADESPSTLDPFVWQAVFPELPGLDSWTFDVVMPCQRLELRIGFPGEEEPKLLTPTFGPYFEPRQLNVFATDVGEPRIRGPIRTPTLVIPFIASLLVTLLYLLIRTFTLVRLDLSRLELLDAALLSTAVILIWLGYATIRRRVYPVISGYRFMTPPYPNEAPGSEPP